MKNNSFKFFVLFSFLCCLVFCSCMPVRRAIQNTICPDLKPLIEAAKKAISDPSLRSCEKLWWLIVVALVGIALSVFLVMQGQIKSGIAFAASFGTLLVLSITVIQHFKLIAWIVVILVVAIIVYALWLQKRAIKQLIGTGEVTKKEMDEVGLAKVYGVGEDHGLAGIIQDKATEKMVKKERKKLRPKKV